MEVKYGFRILTRILTSKVQPLVLCIDDLQWSDEGSLNLIESLTSDVQNTNPLLIIGCYRSNEVAEASQLRTMMKNVQGKASKFGFNITDIALEPLNVEFVNQIIMKLLDVDDKGFVKGLADLCFQRTLGNPFFLIEFMNMLVREELLNFSIGSMKWDYDVSEIENATMSAANVVGLLKSRIKGLPKEVQQMLQYAACLGPTFSVSTLSTIWEHGPEETIFEDISLIVQRVEAEMLIERFDGNRYRWVHDSVQEASSSLINSDIDSFRFV